jgi:quercetin dioxygenase-like cupin family protein
MRPEDLETQPAPIADDQTLDPLTITQSGALVFNRLRVAQLQGPTEVLARNAFSEVVVETLHLGQNSGPFDAHHPYAEQSFVVLEGVGSLVLEDSEIELHAGDVGVVHAGTKRQFVGKGEGIFRVLHVYSPTTQSVEF